MADKKFRSQPSYQELLARGIMISRNSTINVFDYRNKIYVAQNVNGTWQVVRNYVGNLPITAAQA